jgi:hypothetical protein
MLSADFIKEDGLQPWGFPFNPHRRVISSLFSTRRLIPRSMVVKDGSIFPSFVMTFFQNKKGCGRISGKVTNCLRMSGNGNYPAADSPYASSIILEESRAV